MDNESQTATPLADPAITAVKDSAGTLLTNPGTTEDTELTFFGVAPANSVALLFDNGAPIGSASVTHGMWEKSATAELGEHHFTVRIIGGPESLPWVITVETIAVPPTITNVVDSGGEVIHESTTFDDAVLVGGSAAAGKTLEFLHNGASIGDVLVDTNGLWTQRVTGLNAGRHNFQVRARYGNNPVSNIRTLTAAVATAPTIESIKDDADVEIPAGGTTFSTSVTLTGTAVAGQQVEIYDGTTLKGTVPATNGTWTLPLSGLAVKAYSFKARGLYGSNPESAARGFNLIPWGEDFETAIEEFIPTGQSRVLPSMTVTAIVGSIYLGGSMSGLPYIVGKSLSIRGIVVLSFKNPVGRVRFGASLYGRDGPVVFEFYGEQQQLVRTFTFSDDHKFDWLEFDFSGTKVQQIKIATSSVDNTVVSAAYVDNFTFSM